MFVLVFQYEIRLTISNSV